MISNAVALQGAWMKWKGRKRFEVKEREEGKNASKFLIKFSSLLLYGMSHSKKNGKNNILFPRHPVFSFRFFFLPRRWSEIGVFFLFSFFLSFSL
jgi:hypothetical protein